MREIQKQICKLLLEIKTNEAESVKKDWTWHFLEIMGFHLREALKTELKVTEDCHLISLKCHVSLNIRATVQGTKNKECWKKVLQLKQLSIHVSYWCFAGTLPIVDVQTMPENCCLRKIKYIILNVKVRLFSFEYVLTLEI